MNILLDYFFPITPIEATQSASTGFLKKAVVIGKPKDGGVTVGTIVSITASSSASTYFGAGAAAEVAELFNAGMSQVYLLPMDDLDLADALEGHESDFFTVLVTSDFVDADITLAQAYGTVTITSYANLISGTDDVVTVAGTAFTAQTGAVVEGEATFRAATGNSETAASLAAQINAHATVGALVEATVLGAVVTIKSKLNGADGNDITLTYTDNDTNVGATLAHLSGGKLSGGAGLMVGEFVGVTGVSGDDDTVLATQAAISNRCAFHILDDNGAKNMFYAFGKLLSNELHWKNQQYVAMPVADDVETLGDAEALFDDKVSFVISDDEFSDRLALFACGAKAIVAPYVKRNLELDLQSAALTYVSGNQPAYTFKQASLLEDELQKVIDGYILNEEIEAGVITVTLEEDNFVASANINIAEPKALWRIFGEMRETL